MDRFINLDKTYTGIIRLGLSSPSMDTETECSEHPLPEDLDEQKILEVREKFLGEIEQTPPMYSAVKIKGKKLYNLARKGKSVERKPRKVFISKFDIEKVELPDIYFYITCSKGTYIRAIADDLGKELNCGGVLYKLRREKIGEFNVKNALTIEQLSARLLSSDKSLLITSNPSSILESIFSLFAKRVKNFYLEMDYFKFTFFLRLYLR